jgi:ABC-type nitrate/sulfonate/bicarbonate transport system substrate-binding protein
MMKTSAFLALLAATIAFANPVAAQQKIPVRAAYVPAVTWLAAWVAKDKGYFDEQGLDVSFIIVQNISLVPSTVGKQLDIAPATVVDLIKASAGGLNVVAVAGGHSDTESAVTNTIIVRKDSGIRSIKDIVGKTVATPTLGAILHVGLLHWMVKEGLDVNSIRAVEVPFPNMPDQMAAGRIDVAEAVQPFATRMIAAGHQSLGDQLLQVASPARSTLWISDRAWAEANKPTIAKWTAALRQAKELIEKSPEEARQILAKYTKLPPAITETITLPHYEATLKADEIEVWIKVLKELGQLPNEIDASKLLVTAQ